MKNIPYKILGLSDSPITYSGYANQTRGIFSRLALHPEFDCAVIGHNYVGMPMYVDHRTNVLSPCPSNDLYRILPGGQEKWGQSLLQNHIKKEKAEILWTLLDSFMLFWMLDHQICPAKHMCYFPSDGLPLPRTGDKYNAVNLLKKAEFPICMSSYGMHQARESGVEKCEFIPHAVDKSIFFSMDEQKKKEIRVRWSNIIGVDITKKFIVGTVGRFQGRKMLPELIKAFKDFSEKKDTILLIHADEEDPAGKSMGVLVRDYIKEIGAADKIFFTGTSVDYGFTDKQMGELYNIFDVFALCTCFTPDTPIQTSSGTKNIEDIEKGDWVLTSAGCYRVVLDKIEKKYNGKILKIKADGLPEVKCTPNHKIYRIPCSGPRDKSNAIKGKMELVPAGNLSKYDYLAYPIPNTNEDIDMIETRRYLLPGRNQTDVEFENPRARGLPFHIGLDYEFGLVCGFYLSEGCSTKDGLAFCFHTKEDYYYMKIDQILNNRFSLKTRINHNTRNRTTLWTTNSALGRMFADLFGKSSHEKKLPEWILESPKEFRRGLVEGLWKGDGCVWKRKEFNGTVFELQTVSRSLGNQTFNLLIAEGFIPTMFKRERQSTVWGLRLNGEQGFGDFVGMTYEKTTNKNKSRIWSDENNVYFPISKINEEKYEGNVYDLTVDKEHNYVCNFLVKNSGEGFGIPTIEAMACGVPVVATDFTTTKELVIDTKSGLAAKVAETILGTYNVQRAIADKKDFTEKLQTIYDDDNMRKEFGENGIKAVNEKYTWEKVMPQWIKAFREAVA